MPQKLKTHRERIGRARALDDRPSSARRGYDARWQRLRNWFLADHPLCRLCAKHGLTTPAREVDHVVPIRRGGARLEVSNLQALCKSCHSSKTARERGGPMGGGGGRTLHRAPDVTVRDTATDFLTGFGGE